MRIFTKSTDCFYLSQRKKPKNANMFWGLTRLAMAVCGSQWQSVAVKMSIDHDFAQKKCVRVTDGNISLLVFPHEVTNIK